MAWVETIKKVGEHIFLRKLESVKLVGQVSRRSEGRIKGPRELVFHVLFKNGREGRCRLEEDSHLVQKLQAYLVG